MQTFEDVTFTSFVAVQPLCSLLKQSLTRKPSRLITSFGDKLCLWNEDLELLREVIFEDTKKITSVIQLMDGKLAIGFNNGRVLLVNSNTFEIDVSLDKACVLSIIQLRNGLLVHGGNDHLIRLWDVYRENPICLSIFSEASNILRIFQLRDGRIAYTSCMYQVHILELQNRELVSTGLKAKCLDRRYMRTILQLDDHTLIVGGEERIIIFDLATLIRKKVVRIDSTITQMVPWKGRILCVGTSRSIWSVNEQGYDMQTLVEFEKHHLVLAIEVTSKNLVVGCDSGLFFFDLSGTMLRTVKCGVENWFMSFCS